MIARRKRIIFLFSIIVIEIAFGYWSGVFDAYLMLFQKLPELKERISDFSIEEIEKKIFIPEPLRVSTGSTEVVLTREGVIEWTNSHREENGLRDLSINQKLNTVATLKAQDMFEQQYFAHVSPSGIAVDDLVKEVGYEFIMVGENLALGGFSGDKDLVQNWMDSPGHRANILNKNYEEIGVAVEEGMFEGELVWLAVQSFGLPLSACPEPDELIQGKIATYEDQLKKLEMSIQVLKSEIEISYPKRGAEYNQKVKRYNSLVTEYNSLINETKVLVSEYNNQVYLFNECLER